MNKYEYCLRITENCLKKIEAIDEQGQMLLEWVNNYHKDALYYKEKGDEETALEAIAYAHGFIDAGVLLGHFKIPNYHLTSSINNKE